MLSPATPRVAPKSTGTVPRNPVPPGVVEATTGWKPFPVTLTTVPAAAITPLASCADSTAKKLTTSCSL